MVVAEPLGRHYISRRPAKFSPVFSWVRPGTRWSPRARTKSQSVRNTCERPAIRLFSSRMCRCRTCRTPRTRCRELDQTVEPRRRIAADTAGQNPRGAVRLCCSLLNSVSGSVSKKRVNWRPKDKSTFCDLTRSCAAGARIRRRETPTVSIRRACVGRTYFNVHLQ